MRGGGQGLRRGKEVVVAAAVIVEQRAPAVAATAAATHTNTAAASAAATTSGPAVERMADHLDPAELLLQRDALARTLALLRATSSQPAHRETPSRPPP